MIRTLAARCGIRAIAGCGSGRSSIDFRCGAWSAAAWCQFRLALHQLHGTVCVDAGKVRAVRESAHDDRTGAGFELNADVGLLCSGRVTLRLGYAHGFDSGGDDESYARLGVSF